MGEVLAVGCVLGGVGEGFAGEIGGRGAFLHVHQGQSRSLLFRDADIFAGGKNGLRGGLHQCGAGFVRACPDAVVAGDGGVHRVGACLGGGQDDGAAGDFVGAAVRLCFGTGFDIETAVCGGCTGHIGAGKVYDAVIDQIEGIGGSNVDGAALEGGGAL